MAKAKVAYPIGVKPRMVPASNMKKGGTQTATMKKGKKC